MEVGSLQIQKSMNLLSVLVPIKNMSGRLTNIEIWLQRISHYNLEVIFIVDSSNDETFTDLNAIVDSNNYKRVKIIKGNFGGPGDARNFGITQAAGEWLAFWDSDDNPNVDAFVNMVNDAQQAGKQIAIGGWRKVNSNLEMFPVWFKKTYDFKLPNFFKTVRNPGIWRWAFKRPIVEDVFFPNLLMGEDQVFLANLNIDWLKVYRYKKNVYDYIQGNPSQLTTSRLAIADRLKMSQHLVKTPVNGKKFSFFTRTLRIKIKLSVFINRIMS
jgi:glycosyltransferase involved in cell wall biosynthesis